MRGNVPKVAFYVPSPELVRNVPARVADYWSWIHDAIKSMPGRLPSGELYYWSGAYNWTIQTFMYLREYGFPCELTASIPDEGIVVAHSKWWPVFLTPSSRQLFVEIKPDKFLQCIFTNVVVVQNRRDPLHEGWRRLLIESAVVNNWPQPGLMPRDPRRGTRFENVCFMGYTAEFIKDVEGLAHAVQTLGVKWEVRPKETWHDYRDVDAVVAVRPAESLMFNRKPATRLTNAWLAGVPAVLSPDIAFEDLRTSELDYLRARDVGEIIEALKTLMASPDLRVSMMRHAGKRSEAFTHERNVQLWIDAFEKHIIPAYWRWRRSPLYRAGFISSRLLVHKTVGVDPYIGD